MPRTGEITEQERLRRRAGYSVTGFAKRIRYSHTYVSLVETRRLKPSERYRRRVAKALGVPEAVVFPGVTD